MKAVVFSGGKVENGFFVEEAIKSADIIIAADSGADTCLQFGLIPTVVLGDFDSISSKTKEKLQNKKVEFIQFKKEKNETDTELALNFAIKNGATEIRILGGVEGNRLDHVLGNVFLQANSSKIYFVNGNQRSWIIKYPAKEKIQGKNGDLLSLIPIGEEVSGLTTSGLKYALNNETLFFGKTRGLSNVFKKKEVQIDFKKGLLLVIQTSE